MTAEPRQIALDLYLRDEYSFDNFYTGANQLPVYGLQAWVSGQGNWFVFLSGAAGSGVSHLMQASCLAAQKAQRTVIYLPMLELAGETTELLDNLENMDFVCIDNIEAIAGDALWEEGIFHLYNRISAEGGRLLIAGRTMPSGLKLSLADLESRLNSGVSYRLNKSSDEDKLSILRLRASCRGFELSEELAKYILVRSNRQLEALIDVLDKIDKHSLESKRKVTIPFVKELMAW